MISLPDFWFGTDASLALVLEARERYLSDPSKYPPRMPKAKLYDSGDEDGNDTENDPWDPIDENIQIENGVGILTISGPLVAQESPIDHWYGVLSYPAVSRGVIKLAQKYAAGEIGAIIHVVDSNGGSAEGISGLSETMQEALKIAPRTYSFTSSKAFSAGYWIAVTNPKLYAAPMAEVGSIGVISVATTLQRMYKEMGIDHAVVRSGKDKAQITPFEAISDKALAELQSKTAKLHEFFKEHVTAHRPELTQSNAGEWATGKTFFADEAQALGMLDGQTTLNALVEKLVKQNDKRQTTSAPSGVPYMATQVLFPSDEARAAAMAGVPLNQVPHEEVEAPPVEDPPVPEANAGDQPAPEAAIPPAPAGQSDSALVALLREAQAQVTELTGKVATLTSQMEAHAAAKALLETETASLLPVAVEATHRFQVALGQAPTSLDGLPAATVVAQYSAARALLEERFPTGRKSLSAAQTDPEGQPDPQLARITLAAGEHTEREATL